MVLSELRQRQDHSPDVVQLEWLAAIGMEGHPYGRSIAGTEASLRSITLADVRAWMKVHYTPARAIAVICSPLPAKDAAQAFATRFDDLFFGSEPSPARVDPGAPRRPRPLPKLREGLPLQTADRPRRAADPLGGVDRARASSPASAPGQSQRPPSSPRSLAGRSGASRTGSGERYVDGMNAGIWELDAATLVYARIELRDEADAQWILDKAKGYPLPGP